MTERLLFGPGPSLVTARVMGALARPVLGHLDPVLLGVMDDLRARLARVFRAPAGSRVFAISGTGTSAMEAAVANLSSPAKRRWWSSPATLASAWPTSPPALRRRGRTVECEWGRAIDPAAVDAALAALPRRHRRHRPRRDLHGRAQSRARGGRAGPRARGACHRRLRHFAWRPGGGYGRLGPGCRLFGRAEVPGRASGLAPIAFAPSAIAKLVACRSFYLDAAARGLLGRPQVPPHDLLAVGLRVSRGAGRDRRGRTRGAMGASRAVHAAFAHGVEHLGLSFLVPADERLMTLNTVRVPDGVDEATVRTALRNASASRLAPAWARWPARSGASA